MAYLPKGLSKNYLGAINGLAISPTSGLLGDYKNISYVKGYLKII
jgi:hypothetical protein